MKKFALVIDDHRETADSLVQMLGLLGYDTQVAYGPLTGVSKFAHRAPQVILLDIHMLGMDGLEVCRFIRRDPLTARVPIVAISSDTQPTLIERMREAGANAFLPKPISMEALEQTLTTLETPSTS